MKKKILGLALLVSANVFAAPEPLTKNVPLKNSKFSQKIYEALEKKIPATRSGTHTQSIFSVTIPDMISCNKVITLNKGTRFGCTLLKNGWRSMGMEVYGSGFKQDLTKALYNSLSVKVVKEEGISFKTIELEVPDQDGGTERNLLSCTRMGKEAEEMGFRDTCEVINGL